MTPTRAARQADTTCAELDQLAALLFGGPTVKDPRAHYANLRRQIHQAISRDNITAGIDGYRSRHGSTDGGGNSDSTPVEAAALRLVEGGQPADIVHAKVTLIVASVHTAWRAANGWDNALRLIPTQVERVVAEENDPTWCRSCLRFGIHSPRWQVATKGGGGTYARCSWCVSFVNEHGMEPPEALVRAHADGKRITQADLVRHMPAGHKPKKVAVAKWRDGSTTGLELTIDPPNPAA